MHVLKIESIKCEGREECDDDVNVTYCIWTTMLCEDITETAWRAELDELDIIVFEKQLIINKT